MRFQSSGLAVVAVCILTLTGCATEQKLPNPYILEMETLDVIYGKGKLETADYLALHIELKRLSELWKKDNKPKSKWSVKMTIDPHRNRPQYHHHNVWVD